MGVFHGSHLLVPVFVSRSICCLSLSRCTSERSLALLSSSPLHLFCVSTCDDGPVHKFASLGPHWINHTRCNYVFALAVFLPAFHFTLSLSQASVPEFTLSPSACVSLTSSASGGREEEEQEEEEVGEREEEEEAKRRQ